MTIRNSRSAAALAAALTTVAVLATASAQQVDIEVPVLILDGAGADTTGASDEAVDLANIVQTAAKNITTVQQAPAIVSVVTSDEIEARGVTRIDDALDTLPGWLRTDAIHNVFPYALTRGTLQAMLYMQNGVSMFDSMVNVPVIGRMFPTETIKRIEVVTGPGGVLWGANSFLGVVNVITKDADDVDGVEAGVRVGDGPGDRGVLRGYTMVGLPELLHEDVSAMLHASFETYDGPAFNMPQTLFKVSIPSPNAPSIFGPLTASEQTRSTIFQLNGKLNVGDVTLAFHAPIMVEQRRPMGLSGVITRPDLPEDRLRNPDTGELACEPIDPFLADGTRNPEVFTVEDRCVDRGRRNRGNRLDLYDRYAMAEYTTRFIDDRAGATFRGYVSQFTRDFRQLPVFAPTSLLEGGLSVRVRFRSYRVGAGYDGSVELSNRARVLYGGETFREWMPDDTTISRQGEGVEATILTPYDLSRITVPCPFRPMAGTTDQIERVGSCPITAAFATNRTVVGAYLNPQWHVNRLRLDGGVRVQSSPDALSDASYATQLLVSGAAVYNFAKNWHVKLNYAEGFRPPVFNNTNSNGRAFQIQGDPNLEVETSQAIQAEINARVFKNKRSLREVNFRADYSYTLLRNLIQVVGSGYENAGDRGIHSAEFLGKIYLTNGHRVELGYTWLKAASEETGRLSSLPEHWFNLSGFYTLIPGSLSASSVIKVIGATEDPNRIVEHRNVQPDPETGVLNESDWRFVQPHELTEDRLPPAAVLTLGLTWLDAFGIDRLRARVVGHNLFNTRYYNPDGFGNYEPRLEILPNPYPDFRFTTSLTYSY